MFLGIDAGSTTTKAAVINRDKELVFEHYQNNEGDPLAWFGIFCWKCTGHSRKKHISAGR